MNTYNLIDQINKIDDLKRYFKSNMIVFLNLGNDGSDLDSEFAITI